MPLKRTIAQKSTTPEFSPIICDNQPFLRALACTKSQGKRKFLLKRATTPQLLSLAEICLNIVKSIFQLTTRQKKRILPYADFVRRLSRVRTERGAHRLIVQRGSGLPLGLFPALLTPLLVELGKFILTKATD
jgi:hypothetical protein